MVLELLRDVPVGVSEAPDAFLVTLAPLGMGAPAPSGMREAQLSPWRVDMSTAVPLVVSAFQISASVDP